MVSVLLPPQPPQVDPISVVARRWIQSPSWRGRALFSGVSSLCSDWHSTPLPALSPWHPQPKKSDPRSGNMSLTRKIVAELLAGGIRVVVGSPADAAMVRMQADGWLPSAQRRNYSAWSTQSRACRRRKGSLAWGSNDVVSLSLLKTH